MASSLLLFCSVTVDMSGKKKSKILSTSPSGDMPEIEMAGPSPWLSASGLPPELLLDTDSVDSGTTASAKKRRLELVGDGVFDSFTLLM